MNKRMSRHQLVFLFTTIGVIFISSASVFAQDKIAKNYRGLPITKQSLIKTLELGKLRESEVVEIIRENGVNFSLQPAAEKELKAAGAGAELIETLRQNYFVSLGVVNGKAASLAAPVYPSSAAPVHASGAVNVAVLIDENGNVIKAHAVNGHPLLGTAAEEAARASTFSPAILSGKKVQTSGIIVYNFVAP